MKIYTSNQLESLADRLCERLYFSKAPLFQRKVVILPHKGLKNELMRYFLDRKNLGIATGVNYYELLSGVHYLYKLAGTNRDLNLPSTSLLALHLEHEISRSDAPIIQKYLNGKRGMRQERFASALAREFIRNLHYGGEGLRLWLEKEGWQQELWREVFKVWDLPSELIQDFQPRLQLDVHLFHLSHIPPVYFKFFDQLSKHWNVFHYQLSPCQMFWGDICSDSEQVYLQKKTPEDQREEMRAYLGDRNRLLANFGRVGRETLRLLEDHPTSEEYVSSDETTLLERVQQDILEMRNPEASSQKDGSIGVHAAHSELREVETVKLIVQNLMQKEEIPPSEILILAPDISKYAPFLKMSFDEIPFSVSDLDVSEQSEFLQGVLHLFSLIDCVWEKDEILKLLSFSSLPFAEISEWIEMGGIRWGYDKTHRLAMGAEDPSEFGTWSHALKHLLLGLVMTSEGVTFDEHTKAYWPLCSIPFSQAETLGELIEFLRHLRRDLEILEKGAMTLDKWALFLKEITQRCFGTKDVAAFIFTDELEKLGRLAMFLPEAHYTFSSLRPKLEQALRSKTGTFQSHEIEAVRCASFKPGAIFPKKAIILMGMDEESFPRNQTDISLNEVKKSHFEPTQIDQDRFLFLEALLSTRKFFICSYVNVCEKDGKDKGYSPLIEELFAYLGMDLHCVHPFFHFDRSYFEKNASLHNYSQKDFEMAKRFYQKDRPSDKPFIPELLEQMTFQEEVASEQEVTLRSLQNLAKNPIRFYFNEGMGIYLKGMLTEKDEGEFILSDLDKAIFRKRALTRSLDGILDEAELGGKVPLGPFREVAARRVSRELGEHLQKEELNIELKEGCHIPMQLSPEHWIYPPLEISGACITGTLQGINENEMWIEGRKTLADVVAVWPLYLVYRMLFEGDLVCLKDGERINLTREEAKRALEAYLLYYKKAKSLPSPLVPRWSEALLKQDDTALQKAIASSFSRYIDPYLFKLFGEGAYSHEKMYASWAPYLKDTFNSLVDLA